MHFRVEFTTVDTGSLLTIATIYTGKGADAIVMSPAGDVAYMATSSNKVIRVDMASSAISGTWNASVDPGDIIKALALSPDGRRLYATIENRPVINEVSTLTGNLVATIRLPDAATAVQSSVEGRYLFAALTASNSVARIDTARNAVTHVLEGFSSPSAIAPYAEARTNLLFRGSFDQ